MHFCNFLSGQNTEGNCSSFGKASDALLGTLVPWCSAWCQPCKIETVFPFKWDSGLDHWLLLSVLAHHCCLVQDCHRHLESDCWLVLVPRLLPCCEDWALPVLAFLPLVHTDCEALCRVCYLDCSHHQVGLGSLLLVGCLVGEIKFLLLAKK